VKRRRRVEDARDESSPEGRFEHSSHHSDLGSLLDEHSYGADAETAMRAWLESRRSAAFDDAAEPPVRTHDELQRVLRVLESAEAERSARTERVARPEPSRTPTERAIAPAS
jgi:hypothetical protein